jgi:hypothetical protein
MLNHVLSAKTEARFYRSTSDNEIGCVLAHNRTMFETVTRAPANDPYVIELRMSIDQEITLR